MNLALEQWLTEKVQRDELLLYLWQNERTVVIGRNQNAWKEVDLEALTGDGGKLARRFSGGGAVYHDLGNLNFSFCVHRDNYDVERQLEVIAEAVRSFGIPAERTGRTDLAAYGKKFSGNAFRHSPDTSLQHGTLLVSADMEKLTVRSDKSSQKINDVLQLVERERLAELYERDSLKKAKINRQRGERLLKAVRENRDNILSAFALSQVYTEMSYEELKPYLNDDYAFSHHILLSPMREYVEGLEKRKPGTQFVNLELIDTKGQPHLLSEYIGKGYVVLHFWHGLGAYGFRILPSMKTLYDTYHSRGVEFVTLAFDFGVQEWRKEVEQRRLPWPQLMPDPDTNQRHAAAAYGIRSYPELIVIDSKGTIVACPRNLEELGSVLHQLK